MTAWLKILGVAILAAGGGALAAPATSMPAQEANSLAIRSVAVDGKSIPFHEDAALGAFPQNITFGFGALGDTNPPPLRLRYQLEGYDPVWRENEGSMTLTVRFFDPAGDQFNQQTFPVSGASPGWRGRLENSSLTHRRESIIVPPNAARLWIVISSAGPPAAVGIYVVDNLVVSRLAPDGSVQELMRPPLGRQSLDDGTNGLPAGWIRDGTHPSMAKIIDLGANPATKAFAVLDDDPGGHAEWHNIMEFAPKVAAGDHVVVEWNELFSLGMANVREAHYDTLPPGKFRFRVGELTAMGVPTGAETSLAVIVPLPFWQEPWSWLAAFALLATALMAAGRYAARRRLRREMLRLEKQHALEQERLRIAHDIHDDLGARVTQISLFSALAHDNPAFPEKARTSFDQISQMSRELVAALYETVWAVNPENDNLDALGNYLCQMANQLCEKGGLRCRLHVSDLPNDFQISSQTRHNISMAVKEAVHNIIKHAKASEVTLRIDLVEHRLSIRIEDDGCGFQTDAVPAGNGLKNLKQRLESVGGTCDIESRPGEGTRVHLRLELKRAD